MAQKGRTVRVFISSTFQDMHQERDILIKKVFPELRRMCMERGVGFTEVDLRWGVTREQAERGEVLAICLAEIENCRPYFIGLLGERYGWVPDFIPDELIEDQPWLAEHQQQSVTELEIVHGVLDNPDMANHAFFYFRKPPASPAHSENQVEQNKLAVLKNCIRQSGFPVSENYPDAEAVGRLIFKDLEDAIDKEFPEQQLTPLERDRLDHQVFAESRARVYIGRQEYIDRLDDHALGTGDPLVILGESGSGKSALLANWSFSFREKHPDTFLIQHFIGSSTDSTDYIAMLRRIMVEIKERYDLQDDIPDKSDDLCTQFPKWLSMAAARGRFVLVLDALNQLEDKDNAPDLVWLPKFIPPEVRLIVSTLPGCGLDELKKRDWPAMEVQLLEPEERQQLIREYLLKLYSKRLPRNLTERIASQEQCANPLYLHALLEELRVFGKHEEIESRVDHYLQANSPEKLYELVLARLEEDYEKDRSGLVCEAMTLLWAARQGLSEPELLEIMDDLPPLLWSPLYLALLDSLVTCSGLLTFSHEFLRQAVHARYIKTPETEKAAHLRIADYFEQRDIDQRKIEELPWQIMKAKLWQRLKDCITNIEMFLELMSDERQYELTSYWLTFGKRFDMVAEYTIIINLFEQSNPDTLRLSLLIDKITIFLALNARYEEALPLAQKALDIKETIFGPNHLNVADALTLLAGQYLMSGRFEEAELLERKALGIYEAAHGPSHMQVAVHLDNLGAILVNANRFSDAEPLFKRAIEIHETCHVQNHPNTNISLATCLNNLGSLLFSTNRLSEAESLLRRALDIDETIFGSNDPRVMSTLNGLAVLLKTDNRPMEAEPLYRKALGNIESCLGPNHPSMAKPLINLAMLLYNIDQHDEAHLFFIRAHKIFKETLGPNHKFTINAQKWIQKSLHKSLGYRAQVLFRSGDMDGAIELMKRQEYIFQESKNKVGVSKSLEYQAMIYFMHGDLSGALKCYKRQETICREIKDKNGLQESLGGQANCYIRLKDMEHAMSSSKECEAICREIDNKSGLQQSLSNQGSILADRGDPDSALVLFDEQVNICREIENIPLLASSLVFQSLLLSRELGRYKEALPLAEEAIQLCIKNNLEKLESATEIRDYIQGKIRKKRFWSF